MLPPKQHPARVTGFWGRRAIAESHTMRPFQFFGSLNFSKKERIAPIKSNRQEIDVIQVYQSRSGIESLFKDCKTGGYNLEGTKACIERLNTLVLLIAMAYTIASLKGDKTRCQRQQKYICRLKEVGRSQRRHSNFWIGFYGLTWTIGWDFCRVIVEKLIHLNRSKIHYF